MKKLLCVVLVVLTISGYAQDSTNLTPEPGKALVVFVRPAELMSALDNWVLLANGEEFCRVSNNRYVLYQAKPGKYNFTAKRGGIGIGKPVTGIDFDVKEGEIYYVQCQVKSNLVSVRILLNEITKRTAEGFLKKAKPDNCQVQKTEAGE